MNETIQVPLIGDWTIERNPPYGVVIRNVNPNSTGTEYHFSFQSNGWITAKAKGEITGVLGPYGPLNLSPELCDLEATKKYERIKDLRQKGTDLTPEESKELLVLCGLIKEK